VTAIVPGKEREALGAYINSIVNAAHRGDRRVNIDNPRGVPMPSGEAG
jgi:hypothetical protein